MSVHQTSSLPPTGTSPRLASQWLALASQPTEAIRRTLSAFYGHGPEVIADRVRRLATMSEVFLKAFGDTPVVVARAPARVNLMGRHIDHQGGHCNMMAIEPDVYVMAGPGQPGRLSVRNLDADRFPAADVDLGGLLEGYSGGEWRQYVATDTVHRKAAAAGGAWHYYLVAALARLTAAYPAECVRGLRAVIAGNVPVAAGLSSSSALVVAASEAIACLSGLEVPPATFVTLCAEAEWYVGTRGGAGDQAAMKYAQHGAVVRLGFLPLRLEETAPWPDGFVLLVAHSGSEARKSAGARDVFNQRVACYHIGRTLLIRNHPSLAAKVEHLRDLTPHALGASDAHVVEMMRALPTALSREAIGDAVGCELAAEWLTTHDSRDRPYPVRGVVLFGLAECERSRRCTTLIREGRLDELGQLMRVSHDGDRVSSLDGSWQWPAGKPYDDDVLAQLAEQCRAGHRLALEPGAYACSTPDLDAMVDIVGAIPGVLGAQVSGAGLGGCMMALLKDEALEAVQSALVQLYYEPRSLPPVTLACRPVAGCGILQVR